GLPTGEVKRLKGFVGEVEGVANGDIAVVGGGGEKHIGQIHLAHPGAHSADQRALAAFVVADGKKLAEPTFEGGNVRRGARERLEDKARRRASGVARDGVETVVEGARAIVGVKAREEVGKTGEHSEALAPAHRAVTGAKLEAGAERLARVILGAIQQSDGALGEDETNVLLEAVVQAGAVVGVRVTLGRGVD